MGQPLLSLPRSHLDEADQLEEVDKGDGVGVWGWSTGMADCPSGKSPGLALSPPSPFFNLKAGGVNQSEQNVKTGPFRLGCETLDPAEDSPGLFGHTSIHPGLELLQSEDGVPSLLVFNYFFRRSKVRSSLFGIRIKEKKETPKSLQGRL